MVAGVDSDGLARQSDKLRWAVEQLARLERGDPVDRFGLAAMLRQNLSTSRAESRACLRALVKAQLLREHGPVACQAAQGLAELVQRQRLQSMMTPSLALELSTEWPRLYRAGATQAAEELRDLGGDPDLLPRNSASAWTDFQHYLS